jgi:hypothetical protein
MGRERKRPLGQARAWIAALAITAAGIAVTASPAAALPANFWGVSPQATPTVEEFQRLHAGGVDSVRIPVGWGAIETAPGVTDFSPVDRLVSGAAQAGIDILPFIYNAPSWAVSSVAVPGSHGSVRAPKTLPVKTGAQRAAWENFLRIVVGRYGPGGAFWAANPALPERPIRTWQIWNEQNFMYFVVRPSPADYGKLVNISSSAIKSVDPGAKLILGGMFARPKQAEFKKKPPQAYFATDFLDQLYKTTPGIKNKFSGVALHPYTTAYQQLAPDIEEFRAVLKDNHDAGKGLWITEIGWSSEPKSVGDYFAKGPKGQVAQLNGAFKLFKQKQAKWKLQRVYWFSVDDQPGSCNFCGGTGLFGTGFVPKQSWFAYVKFAGGRPG